MNEDKDEIIQIRVSRAQKLRFKSFYPWQGAASILLRRSFEQYIQIAELKKQMGDISQEVLNNGTPRPTTPGAARQETPSGSSEPQRLGAERPDQTLPSSSSVSGTSPREEVLLSSSEKGTKPRRSQGKNAKDAGSPRDKDPVKKKIKKGKTSE